MGAMKNLAITLGNLGYDMTTLTLRDVLAPTPDETPAARMRRLAAKAVIEGCEVFYLGNDTGRFAVTSGSCERTAYLVDVDNRTCTCDGFIARSVPCKHLCLAAAEVGCLPDPAPQGYVPRAVAVARDMADTLAVA